MPGSRRPSPTAAGVAASCLVLLGSTVLAGCGGSTVEVRSTGVTGAQRTACQRLVDALPQRVADLARRDTSGGPGAAWGDPPIVLRCGVGTPAAFGLTSQCQVANGLGWYVPVAGMNDQSTDVVMTTIERRPRVEVTLPARYRPPVATMVDLARAIKAHTRLVEPCR